MVTKKVAEFEIEYIQIMDEMGRVDKKLMPKLSSSEIKKMYELMVLSRTADTKCIALQRTGRMGTYASYLGQEAAQVGSVFALTSDDWVAPSYREGAALLTHGQPLKKIMQFWAWDERGHQVPGTHNLPMAIPIGSQTLHATGIAWALKIQKKKGVVVGYFGDGATSKGDFHEAANIAGVFSLPVVFLCQNNQFAISVPRANQTHAQTIAQKAIAYGFPGIQVDGNDIFAVYKVMTDAVALARAGGGPTLIECITYRMGDHTTSDDAKRYRLQSEVDAWKKKDPIDRLQKYMEAEKMGDEKYFADVAARAKQQIEATVSELEKEPAPEPTEFIDAMYAELTGPLKEQKEYLQRFL